VKAECKRKGLRAFEFAVRVLRLDRGVKPPMAGKRFRMLEQIVKLSVVGTTYPEGLLAVGGDGESTIQIEIGERVTPGQEREVLEEAVKDSVEQAVKQGMLKLSRPLGKPTSEKRGASSLRRPRCLDLTLRTLGDKPLARSSPREQRSLHVPASRQSQ
jgi:hypothetical protein